MGRVNLNRETLTLEQREQFERMAGSPVTVLQIGEGNFLRGFADWMLHVCREQGLLQGSVAVTQPRPSGRRKIEQLNEQDRLYTLVVRGIENGKKVERRDIVTVFSQAFSPYEEWERMGELVESSELRFVLSNTTEAGLVYKPEPLTEGPVQSFPGKIAYLLYRRYVAFGGAADKGLIFLPCELLERNGDALRDAVLRYAADWGLPDTYLEWVRHCNRFLNTLVDRIVTGFPDEDQAETWFSTWGYDDALTTTAEPYYLWVIEGEAGLDDELPLRKAGLNVVWTNDLASFQQRKVRMLNAAHTWMAPLGLLHGIGHVREFMEHPTFGSTVRAAILEDITLTLPYPRTELMDYGNSVFERFANPYIEHRLADIAMNSLSKFRTRLLPALRHYASSGRPVPERLAAGLAGLLRYYRVRRTGDSFEGRDLLGQTYKVKDDSELLSVLASLWEQAELNREETAVTVTRLLALDSVWGENLAAWHGLVEAVCAIRELWEGGKKR
ncbi:tagaturonate reductase [Cohnella soli]|uniref:Tagaturonate reductase n=1 Tax=Cohnella soli TaxID=425005 RepID=A0ABW0I285_9BACL